MRREEKRRKFHESLLNTLYPPPSQPQLDQDEENPITNFDVNLIPDDYGLQASSTSASGNDDGESESAPQKLTRAQRKRLRKKKLKEDFFRRKQLVGPLLPSPRFDSDDRGIEGGGGSTGELCIPLVRQNAHDSCGAAGIEGDGGSAGERCTPPVRQNAGDSCGAAGGQSKLKQRRIAKKLAKEKLKPSDIKDSVPDQSFDLITGENSTDL